MAQWSTAGTLHVEPVLSRPELLAEPVRAAILAMDAADVEHMGVTEINPELADTAAFCEHYGASLEASANCVVVAGKRAGELRYAACMILATTRADVNGVVKRRLDVRKASFAPMDDAVGLTGMQYGGITPIGLPVDWPLLLDTRVAAAPELIIGSGTRGGKLLVPGDLLAKLAGAEVIESLAG